MRKDGRANERRKVRMKKGERFERRKRGKSETGIEGPMAGCGVCGHQTHTNSQHLMRTR